MRENKSIFQLVIGLIFGAMLIVGFVLFATYKPKPGKNEEVIGKVVIWGTMDKNIVDTLLGSLSSKDKRFDQVKYIEKSKKTYNQEILEALAAQNSPDLLLLSNEDFLVNRNKIFAIPPEQIAARDYYNTYADAFSIFLSNDGVLGIPFVIDPMVMYFNKNMFATNAIVLPPKKWEEFEDPQGITSKIRIIDSSDNILKSAISFGEYLNVSNYKEILYTLFLQKNNPVVIEANNKYVPAFNSFNNSSDIIKFYTEFSNQANKITYSWNRSMDNSEQAFLAENLAIYFGFASEIRKIRLKNSNLNFDVAEIPSFSNSTKKTVYAKTWAFSIPKIAKNKQGAFLVALKLASQDVQKELSDRLFLPPVRRDMLNIRPKDSFMDIFYKEAIYGNSIIDADPEVTDKIYAEYISNVNTGLRQPQEATSILVGELKEMLNRYSF